MAGASLLVLIDDIASILDDVSLMSQTAAKKTAGMIGDDLAVNANQVQGIDPDRELPVVWAVARGSLVNKAILVPAAIAISAIAPWLITPMLMIGGAYLCFEGAEKVVHRWLVHRSDDSASAAEHADVLRAITDPTVDLVMLEQRKIRGAIRTDFILSAEIIVITLGVVANATLIEQVGVLATVALLMTVCVYGFVGLIVKFDDLGLWLCGRQGESWSKRLARRLGRVVLAAAPRLLKALTFVGTAAMFLVGGSILAHAIPPLANAIPAFFPAGFAGSVAEALLNATCGLLVGLVIVVIAELGRRFRPSRSSR